MERQHLRSQNRKEDDVTKREPKTGQGIGGQGANRHRDNGKAKGDDNGVHVPSFEENFRKEVLVANEGDVGGQEITGFSKNRETAE